MKTSFIISLKIHLSVLRVSLVSSCQKIDNQIIQQSINPNPTSCLRVSLVSSCQKIDNQIIQRSKNLNPTSCLRVSIVSSYQKIDNQIIQQSINPNPTSCLRVSIVSSCQKSISLNRKIVTNCLLSIVLGLMSFTPYFQTPI
jgi:hypothetical protein